MKHQVLLIGGPFDGRRMEMEIVSTVELVSPGSPVEFRDHHSSISTERYYILKLGDYFIGSHQNLSEWDVFKLLIRRYPQPLNE